MLSGVFILSKATHDYFNSISYSSNPSTPASRNWMFPNSYGNSRSQYSAKFNNPLFLNKTTQLLRMLTPTKKVEEEKKINTVLYQSKDSIFFDAKKNILSLHGASSVIYDKFKLQASVLALHLNTKTIHAKGVKDLHNKSIGNPVFTYNDVTKNRYGKDHSTKTRTFFMEKIRYNIDTKRALLDKLLTKQEDAIIKAKQVKKDDHETFYAEDIIFTTCALEDPHFYISTKRAKLVENKQITTGPFRFYFHNTPSPLGCFFGTLFLEGKRTHGIIPPDIGEADKGFYLRNGGYYINFRDYADISILGSIYSSGSAELKNELRYKKRYLCSGSLYYANNIDEKEKGWVLKWAHKTLTHGSRSFNANIDLHSKSYKTFEYEDNKIPKAMENQSSASLSYEDQLVGFPYRLTLRATYNHDLISNFKDWTLPQGTLNSRSWYPFRIGQFSTKNHWFNNIELKHSIYFENHFQNLKKPPIHGLKMNPILLVPSTTPWNDYIENGVKHTIPLVMQSKVFDFFNLKPYINYNEGWYWLPKGIKGPIKVPGFNRVYIWDFGTALDTTLYYTHYFKEATSIEGFRIKTSPSFSFTYTPDFSKKYFEEIEKDQEKKVKQYAFKGLRPALNLVDRATSILRLKLHNTVELKVKKAITSEDKENKQKRTSRKIFLLKDLDVATEYDFKAEQFHLTKGIDFHIASEAKIGQVGKVGLTLTANFDPYLSKIIKTDSGLTKEEPINVFSWNHGAYLGKVKTASFKVNIDCEQYSRKEKNKKNTLLTDYKELNNKITDAKIDFETPWNIGLDFNWIYKKLYEYKDKKDSTTEKYISFNGHTTLVKKWKIGLRTTYNFTERKFQPSSTEISIQRDLHCWQLSYQWYPLGESAKYDFSLSVKANVLKVLKLPRKRTYNKLVIS